MNITVNLKEASGIHVLPGYAQGETRDWESPVVSFSNADGHLALFLTAQDLETLHHEIDRYFAKMNIQAGIATLNLDLAIALN